MQLIADTQFSGSHSTLFISQCSHRSKSVSPACGAGYTGSRSQSLLHRPPKLSEGNKTKTRQSVFSDPRVSEGTCVWVKAQSCPTCTQLPSPTRTGHEGTHTHTDLHTCTHCAHAYMHADTHTRGHGGLAEGVGEAMTAQGGPLGL